MDAAAQAALLSPRLQALFATPTAPAIGSQKRAPSAVQLVVASMPAAMPAASCGAHRALLCSTLTFLLNATNDCNGACRALTRPAALQRLANLLSAALAALLPVQDTGIATADSACFDEESAAQACGLACLLVNVVERNASAAHALAFTDTAPRVTAPGRHASAACEAAANGAKGSEDTGMANDSQNDPKEPSQEELDWAALELEVAAASERPAALVHGMDDKQAQAQANTKRDQCDVQATNLPQPQDSGNFAAHMFAATPVAQSPAPRASTPACTQRNPANGSRPNSATQPALQLLKSRQSSQGLLTPGQKPAGKRRASRGSPQSAAAAAKLQALVVSASSFEDSQPALHNIAAKEQTPSMAALTQAAEHAVRGLEADSASAAGNQSLSCSTSAAIPQRVPTLQQRVTSAASVACNQSLSCSTLHMLTQAIDALNAAAQAAGKHKSCTQSRGSSPHSQGASDSPDAQERRMLQSVVLVRVHTVVCILVGCLLMHSAEAEASLGSKLHLLHVKSAVQQAVHSQARQQGETDVQQALLEWASVRNGARSRSTSPQDLPVCKVRVPPHLL